MHLALERAEERRRACRLELRLQSLLNRLDVGVFRSTLEGQLLEANLAFMELLGVNTLADAHSLNLQELLLHPQERSQLLEQLRQDKQLPARQVELHRADGTQIWVSCSQTLSTTEGETFVDGLVEDISDRVSIEKALQHSREKYRALVIATTQVVWTSDAQGRVTSATESWQALFGQTEEEFKGWGWLNVIHPDEREEVRRRWNQAVATSSFYESEQRMRVVDGRYRDFLVRGVPVREADGSIREWVGTCTDITERKQAASALKQAEEELEIRVAERTAELQRANEIVQFRIQDSGIGIPEADFSSLFESFHRASNVGTIPGTGVGLAIVKKCVDLQGGEITVKSAVDVGTTFTVTLPLLISHSKNTCQPPKSPNSGGREKIRFPPELLSISHIFFNNLESLVSQGFQD